MNTQKEQIDRLFSAFGKNPRPGQVMVYMEWADKVEEDMLENIIGRVIKTEEKLPSLHILWNLIKKGGSTYSDPNEEVCYYCANTGFVPRLFQDSKNKGVPYITMYACKCSHADGLTITNSDGVPGCMPYFENYEVQFEAVEDLNYLQLVEKMKTKWIQQQWK